MKTRNIIIETRWPIQQIGTHSFEVQVPTSEAGLDLTSIVPHTADALKLSDKEVEQAHQASEEAALRAIAILP